MKKITSKGNLAYNEKRDKIIKFYDFEKQKKNYKSVLLLGAGHPVAVLTGELTVEQ